MPNLCLQMLLRGRNTVGYTPYPTEVTTSFVKEATETGIDVFRIFDALNDVDQMRPAIDAVREAGTPVAEVALCYTGDLSSPDEHLYTLDYYLKLAESIVDAGAHVLAIKDMAGLLRAPAARTLVTALRERFDLPVHLHTHDTPGGQLATLIAAIESGVDAVDAASASLAGTTSQPPLSALGRRHRPLAPHDRAGHRRGQRAGAVLGGGAATLCAVRVRSAGAHRSGLPPRDPGWTAVEPAPAGHRARPRREVRADRGHVRGRQRHPGQRRQGHAVEQGGRRPRAAPGGRRRRSRRVRRRPHVVRHPRLGHRLPVRRARRPARRLAGAVPHQGARGPLLQAQSKKQSVTELTDEESADLGSDDASTRRRTLNRLLFPGPSDDYEKSRAEHGDLSALPTDAFWYGLRPDEETEVELAEGTLHLFGVEAVGEPDERGMRNVLGTINGQLRPTEVRDRSVDAKVASAEKADTSDPKQVAVPFAGVVSPNVEEGDTVESGQSVATIEAMKMEASITAPSAGTVKRLVIAETRQAEGGDLLLELE